MSLIVTPRLLSSRAELYRQLASLISAGVGIIEAIELTRARPPHRSFSRPLAESVHLLQNGFTLSESWRSVHKWVPQFDLALIEAGEKSGRLDAVLRMLERHYQEQASLARRVMADLAYPSFVAAFAILIFPPSLIADAVWKGQIGTFIAQKMAIFLSLGAMIFMAIFLAQKRNGTLIAPLTEQLLRMVPILGSARRDLALARLATSLEALLSAGVTIIEAWNLAVQSVNSSSLQRTVQKWYPHLQAGSTPAEMVRSSHTFPDLFASLYSTGETSGQLDETLRRLAAYYQDEGSRKLHALAQWTPRLVYIGILVTIGYYIVSFWSNFYSNILNSGF